MATQNPMDLDHRALGNAGAGSARRPSTVGRTPPRGRARRGSAKQQARGRLPTSSGTLMETWRARTGLVQRAHGADASRCDGDSACPTFRSRAARGARAYAITTSRSASQRCSSRGSAKPRAGPCAEITRFEADAAGLTTWRCAQSWPPCSYASSTQRVAPSVPLAVTVWPGAASSSVGGTCLAVYRETTRSPGRTNQHSGVSEGPTIVQCAGSGTR